MHGFVRLLGPEQQLFPLTYCSAVFGNDCRHVSPDLHSKLMCVVLDVVQGFCQAFGQEAYENMNKRWQGKLARAVAGEQLWGKATAVKL